MPLNEEALRLPADPRSVRRARAWVGDVLERLGRSDLRDAAELGISELVTNAILHADPPILVRVRGTRAHPRVEVADCSQTPPQVNAEMTEEEHLLSTIGRGLGIVALYSSTWGSDVASDGKTVWFEPAAEIGDAVDLGGQVFDFDAVVGDLLAESGEEETLTIRLLGMPVQVFAHFRQRYNELRRELRLLALAHGHDYPVARELSDLLLQVERERRLARGVSVLDEAIEAGQERVDLTYEVPASAPASMARLADMLERADAFCREQRLLALAASPQQLALQRWYLGEFSRQADGLEPTPWPGSLVVEPAPHPEP